MTDASDLDLLVVVDDTVTLKEVKAKYYGQKKGHDWPVDMVFMRESDYERKSLIGGVPMICAQEGKVIYSGGP